MPNREPGGWLTGVNAAQSTSGIVLILESDRLYADLLRRAAKKAFPHAELRFAGLIADAVTTIATRRVELFITGTTEHRKKGPWGDF